MIPQPVPRPRVVSVETAELRRKITRGRAASGPALAVALREGLREPVREALDEAAGFADTRRYLRGWQEAVNKAELLTFPLSPLEPSRFAEQRLGVLEEAVEFWRKEVERWEEIERRWREKDHRGEVPEGTPTPDQWRGPKAAKRIYAEAQRRYDEFAASDFTAAFFYGRTKSRGLTSVSRFDTKVRGGDGRLVVTPEKAHYVLINREPHAKIVERKKKWAFRLAGRAFVIGAKRMRGPAAREFAKASGIKLGRGAA